jgi:hypothetical protein
VLLHYERLGEADPDIALQKISKRSATNGCARTVRHFEESSRAFRTP